ncbi:MAG: Ig-like domain-containing protein [Candidatus Eisenbacteria bacterium]|uniref:Ig-like domain-containing protein n=1 Tax=Eiseniibacteriota bacterium TaxID=2212470 RepID=A0A9D6LBC7_UNCEI|nr:Ig-like domain-containing protein [Candidatus Eisenbacteria bacterium]MBI3540445.1 Ig-like domain-containing protein [Candidatus Eisenbacteria bacterium]
MSRVRSGAAALVLVAIAIAACEKKPATAPVLGGGPAPPPLIAAVSPPARSVRVPEDVPIWAQFSAPLDTTTVNARYVFFKLDTQRIASTITWDAATRRIVITPLQRLALQHTYTIELAPGLRTAGGLTLGQAYFWQFTTSSVRKPAFPAPADGGGGASPFTALRWGGLTEASAGPIIYEVHAAADPVSPADTTLPALGSVTSGPFAPPVAWSQTAPTYWAVHVINLTTHERLVGPVWSFSTLPATTPIDSLVVDWTDWAMIDSVTRTTRRCQLDSLAMSPTMISVMRWRLALVDSTVQLAGAKIEFTPRYATVAAAAGPSVWSATADWIACTGMNYPGPPFSDPATGRLADAVVVRPNRIRLASDALTAHIEATMRFGGFYGYIFRAPRRMSFWGAGIGFGTDAAALTIYRYRPGPMPPAPRAAARLARRAR